MAVRTDMDSKMFFGILALAAIALALPFMALSDDSSADGDTFSSGGLNYEIKDGSSVAVTGFSGDTISDLVIPDTVSYSATTYNVNEIKAAAFAGKGIKTVDLGNVSDVSATAFAGCLLLTKVTGTEVTSIGISAFDGCVMLKSFTGGNVKNIGATSFLGCVMLNSIDLSAALTIGAGAFMECKLLKAAVITKAISIGSYAFYDTGLLAVTIPMTTVSIGGAAFNKCGDLAITVSPLNVRYKMDNGALVDKLDHSLQVMLQSYTIAGGQYTISSDIKKIDAGAFDGVNNLYSVTIPSSVETIGDGIFRNCPNLSTVTVSGGEHFKAVDNCLYSYDGTTLYFVPETYAGTFTVSKDVGSIAPYAFSDCTQITSVDASGVSSIGTYAFSDCSSMVLMYLNNEASIGLMAFDLGSLLGETVTCDIRSNGADFIGLEKRGGFATFNYFLPVNFEMQNAPSGVKTPEKEWVANNGSLSLAPYKSQLSKYVYSVYVDDVLFEEDSVSVAGAPRLVSFRFSDTYTVSFDANGGTGSMAAVEGVVGEYTLPANKFTAPSGKVFDCWSVTGVEKSPGDTITVSSDVTVTAVWALKTYTVTFAANGGTGSMDPVSGVVGDYVLPGNGFTAPEGKYFKCWSVGGTEKAPGVTISISTDVTVMAVWAVTTYTVSFAANGGTGTMADVKGVVGSYVLPDNGFTAPSSKVFECWSVAGVEKSPGDTITVSSDTTVTALWTAETYTVSFDANGGTGTMADVKGVVGSYILPDNGFTAPSGEFFKCWSVGGTEKNPGDTITVTSNVTVKAVWSAITYTVSFDANGGTGTMDPVSGIVGNYKLPANGFTAPSGDMFKCWSMAGVDKSPGDTITVSSDVTVTAVWTVKTYTVTFAANGGTGTMAAVEGVLGDYTLPENGFVAPSGKYFDCWSVAGEDQEPGSTINVSSDVTVTAVWALKTYTVTFAANGGTGMMPAVVGIVGSYELPDNSFTPPSGKAFKCWSVAGDEKAVGASITVSSDVTVLAVWLKVVPPEEIVVEGDTKKVDVNDTSAEISKDTVEALKKDSANVQMDFTDISIKMDAQAFGNMAGTGDIMISAEKSVGLKNQKALDKLSDSKKAIAEKAIILDIDVVTSGSTSGLGTVKISVPYALAPGQSADSIKVYYVADNGNLEELPAQYSDGILTAESSHFSTFAVASESLTEGSGGSGGMNIALIAGGVIAVIAVIGAIVFFMRKN